MTLRDSPAPLEQRLAPALRIGRRSSFLMLLTTLFGIAAFVWPLMIHQHAGQNTAHSGDAPWVFVALIPLLLAIVMAELSEGEMDAKAVALLGVLAACFAALRMASPGINGFEPEWFLLILAARVFGRGFGFVLGALAFFASALITGGVGPWLPFQMIVAAWVGFGAGCLPPMRGFAERLLLAGYGVVSALAYGLLINFWFWPFVGATTRYQFRARARHAGEPPPVHPLRPGHLIGVRLDPGGNVCGVDTGVGSTGTRRTAPRFTTGRLRASDRIHRLRERERGVAARHSMAPGSVYPSRARVTTVTSSPPSP